MKNGMRNEECGMRNEEFVTITKKISLKPRIASIDS